MKTNRFFVYGKDKDFEGFTMKTKGLRESEIKRLFHVLDSMRETELFSLWTSFAFEEGKINVFEVTTENYPFLNGNVILENCIAGREKTMNVKADKIYISAEEIAKFKEKGIHTLSLCTFSKGAPVSIIYNERGDMLFGVTLRPNIKNGLELANVYEYLSWGGKITYKMIFSNTHKYEDMGNRNMFEFLKASAKGNKFEQIRQIEFDMPVKEDGDLIAFAKPKDDSGDYPFNIEGREFFDAKDEMNNLIQAFITL